MTSYYTITRITRAKTLLRRMVHFSTDPNHKKSQPTVQLKQRLLWRRKSPNQ